MSPSRSSMTKGLLEINIGELSLVGVSYPAQAPGSNNHGQCMDPFLKPKIPRFWAFWESKPFDTRNDSSSMFVPTYMSVPRFYLNTQSREFLLVYLLMN